jgi:hypothetical protein
LLCCCGADAARVLARDGQTTYRIATAAEPTEADALAARELAAYLTKATGADFAIVAEGELDGQSPALYVGQTEFAVGQGVDFESFGLEESLVRTVGNNMVLCGGQPRGAVNAVYDFLEAEVGCYWLDEHTEIVPKCDVLKVGRINERREPAFWYRDVYTAQHQCWGSGGGWFRLRNKGSHGVPGEVAIPHHGTPGGCHTFHAYSKDWPDKPELFSLNPQGERDRSTSGSGPGHICTTNPETIQLVLSTLREFIGKDRQTPRANGLCPRVYDISQNDNNSYICCCPTCLAMKEREGSYSGPLLHMINQVADGIRQEYPEILVQTFAYTSTQKPPKTVRPRDNVLIRLCHLGAEFRGDVGGEYFRPASHAQNDTFRTYIRQWSRIAPNLAIWDYWVMYREEFPNPYHNVYLIKDDIDLYRRNNVQTVFIECEKIETTSFFALKRWLTYQLLDEPGADDDDLIEIFMDGYFGPAAPQMTAFLKAIHKLQTSTDDRLSLQKTSERSHWTLAFFERSQALFDEAEAACAAGSPHLLHVRRERIPLDSALVNLWPRFERENGAPPPFDESTLIDRYEAYRLEQMKAYRPENLLARGRTELAAEVAKFRERPLIEKRKQHPPPAVTVPRVPVAGGRGADVDWDRAARLETWFGNLGESCVRNLQARIAHDGVHLYVKLIEDCDTKTLKPTAQIWTGDDWEVFFAPVRGKAPYRQLAVNPAGNWIAYHWAKPMGEGKAEKWVDSGADVQAETATAQWTATIVIPLDAVTPGGLRPGDTFYANFYRASNNIKEVYAWSPNFDRSFHVLSRLGAMTLAD